MVLIPILYIRPVINSYLKGNCLPIKIAELEVLFVVQMLGTCTTSAVYQMFQSMKIYKQYLDVNSFIVRLVNFGYVENHIMVTSTGKKKYRYSITLLGLSILSDFDDHCRAFMEKYNSGLIK